MFRRPASPGFAVPIAEVSFNTIHAGVSRQQQEVARASEPLSTGSIQPSPMVILLPPPHDPVRRSWGRPLCAVSGGFLLSSMQTKTVRSVNKLVEINDLTTVRSLHLTAAGHPHPLTVAKTATTDSFSFNGSSFPNPERPAVKLAASETGFASTTTPVRARRALRTSTAAACTGAAILRPRGRISDQSLSIQSAEAQSEGARRLCRTWLCGATGLHLQPRPASSGGCHWYGAWIGDSIRTCRRLLQSGSYNKSNPSGHVLFFYTGAAASAARQNETWRALVRRSRFYHNPKLFLEYSLSKPKPTPREYRENKKNCRAGAKRLITFSPFSTGKVIRSHDAADDFPYSFTFHSLL